jgi:hypothetical protein
MRPLTEFERSVLDFERVLREPMSDKDEAISQTFDVSPGRYYQFLDSIIKKEAALAYDALLVRRLRRLRMA